MVVAWYWQQWITDGKVYRNGGSGHPKNTNTYDDRAIIRAATSSPKTSLELVQRHTPLLQTSGGIKGNHSKMTVRRRYKEPTIINTPTTDPIIGNVDGIFTDHGQA
ncbi:hypothetical protein TNCV_403241 [Trichonephila clavipes]|nr:hypothetical protein TNCV_403241 [Trichonephila clavipes]